VKHADSTAVRFNIGQVVTHSRFGYRGVIFDVDPYFMLSDEWYRQVALSRPPKHKPWYHVLVDGQAHTTYVAERHLDRAVDPMPIRHPMLETYFDGFNGVCYERRGFVA
jgi:heat shock protein HspQ